MKKKIYFIIKFAKLGLKIRVNTNPLQLGGGGRGGVLCVVGAGLVRPGGHAQLSPRRLLPRPHRRHHQEARSQGRFYFHLRSCIRIAL